MTQLRLLPTLGVLATVAALAPLPATFACDGKACDAAKAAAVKTASAAGDACCQASKSTIRELTLEQVRAIAAGKKKATLIDSRTEDDYKAGHIPTAVFLPLAESKLAQVLPKDKASLVVFYCGSEKCPLSNTAAEKAVKLGYTNVAVYKGGWSAWKQTASR